MRARWAAVAVAAEDEPGQGRGAERGAQHAELRLAQLGAVEGERGDQQRDGEADAGDRAAADRRRPADRRAQPAAAQLRHQPGDAGDADRLAEHVGEDDPERDRRGVGAREEVAVDRDADVGEREERHDHVARPRVVELQQAGVRRDGCPQAGAGRARQLRGRLLAEAAEEVGRPLELAAAGRVGPGDQADREAEHDRVDRPTRRAPPRRPRRAASRRGRRGSAPPARPGSGRRRRARSAAARGRRCRCRRSRSRAGRRRRRRR